MIWNYLKTALRNIMRSKGHSVINVIGLSVAMALCILIFLLIRLELSYDGFHKKGANVFRVTQTAFMGEYRTIGITPVPLAPALEDAYAGIVRSVRYANTGPVLVSHGDVTVREETVFYADPGFFEILTFQAVAGYLKGALESRSQVVLNEKAAEKYFGDADPLGKWLTMDDRKHQIAGVVRVPANTIFQFDFLISMKILTEGGNDWNRNWGQSIAATLVELTSPEVAGTLESQFPDFVKKHFPRFRGTDPSVMRLQPLDGIYLDSSILFDLFPKSDVVVSYVLGTLGVFLLFIACINFINVTLGRSALRGKEVGVRKTLGGTRAQLIGQFWGEALLVGVAALILGLSLAHLLLPGFNGLFAKDLRIDYFDNGSTLLALFGLTGLVVLISGSYPALYMSRLDPTSILAHHEKAGALTILSKVLITMQFTLSIFLMICLFTILRQLQYFAAQDLGFEASNVLVVSMPDAGLLEPISEALDDYPQIAQISAASSSFGPMRGLGQIGHTDKSGKRFSAYEYHVDYDYLPTLGIVLAEGRDFSIAHATDAAEAVIVNEALVREMGWEDPIGEAIPVDDARVIGVTSDYHYRSLQYDIEPVVLRLAPDRIRFLLVRTLPGGLPQILSTVKSVWERFSGELPFEYYYLEDDIGRFYQRERLLGDVALYIAIITLSVALLSVYSLSMLNINRRTKEIGIRRVLGASTFNTATLISRQFVLPLAIAILLVCPPAFLLLRFWLGMYEFNAALGVGEFVLAGLAALVLVLTTVAFQVWRKNTSPLVESLTYE
ncbi:MAG: ABC transporter permease [Gemmatimonadota bacterium]|nr:ABC transporter permease [Gemmatimonadota bacterium]